MCDDKSIDVRTYVTGKVHVTGNTVEERGEHSAGDGIMIP